MHRGGVGMRTAAGIAVSGARAPGGLGGGRSRRHHHIDGEPRRCRSDQSSRHRDSGDAACSIREFEPYYSGAESRNTGVRTSSSSWRTPDLPASLGPLAKGSSPESSSRHTGAQPGWRTGSSDRWARPSTDVRWTGSSQTAPTTCRKVALMLAATLLSLGVVFLAELGDRSQLITMTYALR